MWARGYFIASSSNVTDEVIIRYIEQQNVEPPDGDFSAYTKPIQKKGEPVIKRQQQV